MTLAQHIRQLDLARSDLPRPVSLKAESPTHRHLSFTYHVSTELPTETAVLFRQRRV